MDWTRFGMAVVASGILMCVSDWLFMGVLFHDKYKQYPEVWRDPEGKKEMTKVLWSTLMGFVIAAVFIYVAARWQFETYAVSLKLAVAVWVMGPLPLIISNGMWFKFPKELVVSHSLGWLAKFCIIAVVYKFLV